MSTPCDVTNDATVEMPDFAPAEFRRVLGHFGTGLAIVTAMGKHDEPVGFTCQSFASLSLQPPLVMFSPSKVSRSWPVIREAGKFCINILSARNVALSDRFARSTPDKFDDLDWRLSSYGTPILLEAMAWIECALHQVHEAGDHYIALGAVRTLDVVSTDSPLLFFRGKYASLLTHDKTLQSANAN